MDFTIEVERAMRVLDGAVIVMDGVRGVKTRQSQYGQANRFDVPRALFMNKMDPPGADYDQAMASVEERLNTMSSLCVPIPDTLRYHVIEQQYTFSGDNGRMYPPSRLQRTSRNWFPSIEKHC